MDSVRDAEAAAEVTKAWPGKNGVLDPNFPEARVESNMQAYKAGEGERIHLHCCMLLR